MKIPRPSDRKSRTIRATKMKVVSISPQSLGYRVNFEGGHAVIRRTESGFQVFVQGASLDIAQHRTEAGSAVLVDCKP